MPKVAVLEIAINAYGGGNDLRGCHQDMFDRRAMLIEMGFVTKDRLSLFDQNATLDRIRDGYKWLFSQQADGYFVHKSGHGALVKDFSGDERHDFGFCPFNWERAGFWLDDETAQMLRLAPAGKFVGVFVDACHSESGQRGLLAAWRPRVTQALDIKPRVLPAALHTVTALRATAKRKAELPSQSAAPRGLLDWITKRRSSSTGVLFTDDACLYWGAAQSTRTADDAFINGRYRGAGTYYQTIAYRQLRAELLYKGRQEQPTWEQINKRGNQLLATNGHNHRMQLDGRRELVCRTVSLL
jgi:hypothetical protein